MYIYITFIDTSSVKFYITYINTFSADFRKTASFYFYNSPPPPLSNCFLRQWDTFYNPNKRILKPCSIFKTKKDLWI